MDSLIYRTTFETVDDYSIYISPKCPEKLNNFGQWELISTTAIKQIPAKIVYTWKWNSLLTVDN